MEINFNNKKINIVILVDILEPILLRQGLRESDTRERSIYTTPATVRLVDGCGESLLLAFRGIKQKKITCALKLIFKNWRYVNVK